LMRLSFVGLSFFRPAAIPLRAPPAVPPRSCDSAALSFR